MSCSDKEFRVEAANVEFGRREKTVVDFASATAAALGDTHFLVSSTTVDYYVWFNLDAGGTDPVVAGRTGVEVAINTADNAKAVVDAIVSALGAVDESGKPAFYVAAVNLTCLCIETFLLGEVLNASADGDTGLTFETQLKGSFSDLGCIAEDYDFSPEITETDITCHQEGETPLDKVVTGFTLDIEIGLLDTSKERIKELIGEGLGQTLTPAGGSELIGLGSASIGKSSFEAGGELRIVPVNDPTRSWVFPLAVAKLSTMSYSGVEKQILTMTFSILLDRKVLNEVNFAYFGERDQVVR